MENAYTKQGILPLKQYKVVYWTLPRCMQLFLRQVWPVETVCCVPVQQCSSQLPSSCCQQQQGHSQPELVIQPALSMLVCLLVAVWVHLQTLNVTEDFWTLPCSDCLFSEQDDSHYIAGELIDIDLSWLLVT